MSNNMTDIEKFLENGQRLAKLNIPIEIQDGVDQQRVVVGFASLNNIDRTDDMITEEANMEAFKSFRGNVRFMHQDRPVGKMIDYQPAAFFDKETNKEYRGVQVAVSISETAEDVWKMCLDGTITAFSIGGSIRRATTEYSEEFEKTIRVIHEYQLTELSLVDSPANQLANVQTIYKSIDGVPERDSVQVYGSINKVLEIKTEGDSPQMADNESVSPAEVSEVSENVDTGETEATETVAETEEVQAEETDQVEGSQDETDETDESAESAPALDLDQILDKIRTEFSNQTELVSKAVSDKMAGQVEEQITIVKKEFDAKFAQLETDAQKKAELQETLERINKRVDELEKGISSTKKRLDEFNDSTAFQKSLERKTKANMEPTEENPFAGVFSNRYE